MLSKKSLQLLELLFNEKSNLQLPVGTAEQVVEINKWIKEQLKN